jgi:hypothetical protein
MRIHDGQRITAFAVAAQEPALVIGRPNSVRSPRVRQTQWTDRPETSYPVCTRSSKTGHPPLATVPNTPPPSGILVYGHNQR